MMKKDSIFDEDGTKRRVSTTRVLVSYDIPDDKRRTKVMKTILGYGHRVQFSVFECLLTRENLADLRERLQSVIDVDKDDVRFYPLCEACVRKTAMLGTAKLFEQEVVVVV